MANSNLHEKITYFKLRSVWRNMKNRCLNTKCHAFLSYGGRGIGVCKEWLEFNSFYDWSLNSGYKEGLCLERKNNDKGYSPSNCSWETTINQHRNKRTTVYIYDSGEKYQSTEWEIKKNLSSGFVAECRRLGISDEEIISRAKWKHPRQGFLILRKNKFSQ